jgi:hypothetical protein
MNIRNIALILMVSCIASIINAKPVVYVKNEYTKPIAFSINGVEWKDITLKPGDTTTRNQYDMTKPFLDDATKVREIKIRVADSNTWHTGIQREMAKVINASQKYPNLTATIRILNTKNPFNFEYDTTITPDRPISPTPDTPNRLELMVFNGAISAEQYLNDIIQGKNPAYTQTDRQQLETLKNHANFILKNIGRVQIKTSTPEKVQTIEEKKEYLGRAHPYYGVINSINRSGMAYSTIYGRDPKKFIQEVKDWISMYSNQLLGQQNQQKWLIPYV